MQKNIIRIITAAVSFIGSASLCCAWNIQRANDMVNYTSHSSCVMDINENNLYVINPQTTVLESRAFKSGLIEEVVKDDAGRKFKIYRTNSSRHFLQEQTRQIRQAAASTSSSATAINESFEGYAGEKNWIPQGWERKTNNANPSGADYMWRVSGINGDFRPTNGKYQAFIQYASTIKGDVENPQDEWLISPEFTPESGTRLYADITASLFSVYDPEFYDIEKGIFSKRKVTATMSVKIYSDGEWSEVFNIRNLASRLEDRELFEQHSNPEVHTMRIPLDRFAGKNIKVAFVYSGDNGNSMALDYISVGTPNNMAVYHRPRGFFFEGMGRNWDGDQDFAAIVGPAYVDATWNSVRTRDVESLEWVFTDGYDSSKRHNFQGWTATMKYPYSIAYTPDLTAKCDGLPSLTYQFDIANKATGIVKYGGGGISWNDDGTYNEYGCGAYNLRCGLQAPTFSNSPGDFIFGPGSNERFWSYAGIHLLSIASYYEKPLSPYIFDEVWISANALDADDDAEFIMNVYRIGDNGYLEDVPFATSRLQAKDVIKFNSAGGHVYTLLFPFELQTIDTAILIELAGFMDNDKIRAFSPLTQNSMHVDGETNGYMFYTRNGETILNGTSNVLNNFFCPFIFTLNAQYPFLIAEDSVFAVPEEGGEKTFVINSYFSTDEWSIEEDIPDWIDEIEPFEDRTSDGDIVTGLRLAVESIPSNISGRKWEFTLSAPGCAHKFIVTQGNASSVNEVRPDDSDIIGIFDLSGRKITNVNNLASGVYIVSYSNGTSKKIIK